MKNFFKKKEIFAIIFIICCMSISIPTLIYKSNKVISELEFDDTFTFDTIETSLSDNLFGKYILVDIYGMAQKLMFKHEAGNFEFIKDSHGNFYNGAFYIEDEKNLMTYAKNLRKLGATASKSGARTLFINYPEKNWTATQINLGLPLRDYQALEDQFLTVLMQNRIDNMNLKDYFRKIAVDKNSLYYKTDRSMNTYGNFLSFCAIVNEFENKYNVKLDPNNIYTDLKNYNIEKYPDAFLGNMGKAYGKPFASLEELEIYRVNKPQQYTWEYLEGKLNYSKSGDENMFFNLNYLNEPNLYYRRGLDIFLEGCNDLDKITNLNNKTAPKILCIRDNNFSSIAIFLAPLCSELHLIDALSNIDIDAYLLENKFDYVLMCVSSGHINNHYFDFYEK